MERKPRTAAGGPVGVSKTHAKRDRGRARAKKRKQEEAEQARRDVLGAPKPVGGGRPTLPRPCCSAPGPSRR